MAAGVSYKKIAVYAAVVTILVAANVWRLAQQPRTPTTGGPEDRQLTPVARLPDLSVSRDFAGFAAPAGRDLFRRIVQESAAPEAPEPATSAPQKPDPEAIARARAQKIFDGLAVLGILGSNAGPVAVVDHEGTVLSVTLGGEILPGYFVKSLSLTHLTVRHKQTGLEKAYLINESENN